ncbi:MAG: ATP-binding protein [Burkholderiales bacterium]
MGFFFGSKDIRHRDAQVRPTAKRSESPRLRKPFRIIGALTCVVVLLGGWGYLYLMARRVDLTAQNEIRQHLAHLRSIDSRWNDKLIDLRNSQVSLRDTDFVAPITPTTLALTQHEIAVRAQVLANAAINQTLAELKQAFNSKIQSVDRFASANRALIESQRAFNVAANAAGLRDRATLRVVAAVNAVLAQANAATRRAAEEAIAEFESERKGFEPFVRRAREIAETRIVEEQAFRESIFTTSVGQRIETLSRAVDYEFQRVVDDGELYRVYLLFYSASLLAIASMLALRLIGSFKMISRINLKLRDANEGLERRVSERTLDLERALSQLKQQEAVLIQTEKMSSLGQMVAGVAHEVNTPLAYVKSSLESVDGQLPKLVEMSDQTEALLDMLRSETVDEAALAKQFATVSSLLDEMRANQVMPDLKSLITDGMYGISQISDLVGNLRNFARLDRSKIDKFDLNEGIASALVITKNAIKHKTIKKELGQVPPISCSPSQINQVLLNLINNAGQATNDDASGVITVRTGMRGMDQVFVDVEDNGHGIPEDVLPKIFDPFFTTKDVGKGTGLGLSIVYKIVEQHGGRISVVSKVGVGTRFTVILPITAVPTDRPSSSPMAHA